MPQSHTLPAIGGWPFLITAAAGRLPGAMLQLGALLYITRVGGTLTQAGTAVAVLGVGAAIGAPLMGRLIDRVSPLPVVIVCTLIQLASLSGFAWLMKSDPGSWAGLAIAFVLGAANPQIGSIARGHWAALSRERRLPGGFISRAMGYEGAADEVSFVLGPGLSGVLLGVLGAVPGVIVIGAMTLVLQGAFAAHLGKSRAHLAPELTEPTGAPTHPTDSPEPATPVKIAWLSLLPTAIATAMVGFTFGATQTALTWWFESRGQSGLTGPIYGLVGVGSAISSLLIGRLSPKIRLGWRMSGGALALIVAGLVFGASSTVGLMSVTALLIGLAVGPVLVSGYSLAEAMAPRERLTTVMTVIATTVVLGVSAGASVSSRVVDGIGFAAAPWLLVAAGVVAAVCGAITALQRAEQPRGRTKPTPTDG